MGVQGKTKGKKYLGRAIMDLEGKPAATQKERHVEATRK